ncbi:MAG: DoxX family protein [Halobacteriovoraceae bacterium]|nr:DoxX family protein [Halobacteriovoraceae bacterium]
MKKRKSTALVISRVFQSLLYIIAGLNHFLSPEMYYKIIPPFLNQYNFFINIVSGGAEMILGSMLLLDKTRKWACIGIIILLIAVFPANIYLALEMGKPLNTSPWVAWLRLPLQFLLIYWAYTHLKKDSNE